MDRDVTDAAPFVVEDLERADLRADGGRAGGVREAEALTGGDLALGPQDAGAVAPQLRARVDRGARAPEHRAVAADPEAVLGVAVLLDAQERLEVPRAGCGLDGQDVGEG